MTKSIKQIILDTIADLIIINRRKPTQKEIRYKIREYGFYIGQQTFLKHFKKLVQSGHIERYSRGHGAYRVINPQYDKIEQTIEDYAKMITE